MNSMKRYVFILFIIVIFVSNAAVAMASGTDCCNRNEIIAVVVLFVCLSLSAAFLISILKD